ncbi:MAG: class I SAM-dependent methyltransferase [Burkholderiaceae bacterium]|nr:class I SAM-dependent methyltransferase [Burkholderiaceae bacterium]
MMTLADARQIPGMIEPVEQELLFNLARSIPLNSEDSIVEFGSFFGRSTYCLSLGLQENPTRNPTHKVRAFDSFSCAVNGAFAGHVTQFAKAGNVENLIKRQEDRLDFSEVFRHYLRNFSTRGLLDFYQWELSDSQPPAGNIALMHVDSPKFYDELKFIFYRFFPKLRAGSKIVFQDYFYHWSATLIAAVQVLKKDGWINYEYSAATSLVVTVNKPFQAADLLAIDLQMQDKAAVLGLIDSAISDTRSLRIDRPEVFIPRLTFAKIQYLWELGLHQEVTRVISDFFNTGNALNLQLVDDFIELMSYGFSIRKLYELDHQTP